MCHFVWRDNECTSCGDFYDRKLTYCKEPTTRDREVCNKTYLQKNQPNFVCHQCVLAEAPWEKVKSVNDKDDMEYYSDDSSDGDYTGAGGNEDEDEDKNDASDSEQDPPVDNDPNSSEEESDYESQESRRSTKRKLEEAGRRRNPKRTCTKGRKIDYSS